MIKVAETINSFAYVAEQADVPPEEPIFVLTSSQLQDLISKAIQEATEPLYREIAYDRQRIAKLEHPVKKFGKTEMARAEKIAKYLKDRPDHKASYESLKGFLGADKVLLNMAIKTLMSAYPGKYAIAQAAGDKRKRFLVLLPDS